MDIILIQDEKQINITNFCGNVTLGTSIDSLGANFKFDVARNITDKNFDIVETITPGDLINFENIFFGIIVKKETENHGIKISCLDFYFYLNKNKIIIQFKNFPASECIKQLLKKVGLETNDWAALNTSITKIYKDKTLAYIINDILVKVEQELSEKYFLELEGQKFNLIKYKKIKVKPLYNEFLNYSKEENIVELRNSVIVTSNNEDNIETIAKLENKNSQKKYGKLQEIIQIDPADVSKARNIASNTLKKLNKIHGEVSISVFGSHEIRSGRIIEMDNEEFLIKSCTHKYLKNQDIADLKLEKI
ncbi:hypothetical protein [Fusobacterium sp. IOR10]|uniref:XkdQ/YqbQ family protein n=1 Tax=Fusobacterium sp. IOR10 TaxID=2665157 RepID=UPI0013D6C160|nr:hypothetical protein [Fusobacterium sp. IOR10]